MKHASHRTAECVGRVREEDKGTVRLLMGSSQGSGISSWARHCINLRCSSTVVLKALCRKACRHSAHPGFFQCLRDDQTHSQSRSSVCKVAPLRLSFRKERIGDQKAISPICGMLFSVRGHHQMIQRYTASLGRAGSLCSHKQ